MTNVRSRKMATLRNLKIKTGICRRTLKELHSYVTEVEQESAKTISMKESNADAFDIKQQENVLAESRMMIPDCRKRLEGAFTTLQAAVVEAENDAVSPETEEFIAANELIAEVKPLFA